MKTQGSEGVALDERPLDLRRRLWEPRSLRSALLSSCTWLAAIVASIPLNVFDNVAFGLRLNRFKGELAERVESALRRAALWDEVKDKLKANGLSLSGGQQQRLCIARAIATEPSVVLMDEPASALDSIATRKIEELMEELKENYTIALVTHNMQQAARAADKTAFFSVDLSTGGRTGYLVEFGDTRQIFEAPRERLTQEYLRGEFS
jgi:phosphate transport system ATP-binding protein